MKKKTLSWILCGVFCLAFVGLCITLALTLGKKDDIPETPEIPSEETEVPLHEFATVFAWKEEFSKLSTDYDVKIPEGTTVHRSSALFTAVKDSTNKILLISNKTGNQIDLEGYTFENISINQNFVLVSSERTFIDGGHVFVGYLFVDESEDVHEIYCDNLLTGEDVYVRPAESLSFEVAGSYFVKIVESNDKYQIFLMDSVRTLAGETFSEIDLGDCVGYDVFGNYLVTYTPTKTFVYNLALANPALAIFEFTNTTVPADADDYNFAWGGEYFYYNTQYVVNGITSKFIFVDYLQLLAGEDEYAVTSGVYSTNGFARVETGIPDAEFSLSQILTNGYILVETSTLYHYFDSDMNLKVSFDKNFGTIRFATETYFVTEGGILVDFSGKLLRLPDGLSVFTFTYRNGFFVASKDGMKGIVNQKFETVIDFLYDDITNFVGGVAIGKIGSTYYRIFESGQRFVIVDFDASTSEKEALVFWGTEKYISSSGGITSIRNIDGSPKNGNVTIESITHQNSSSGLVFVNSAGERIYSVVFYPALSSHFSNTYSNDFVTEYAGLSGSAIQSASYRYRTSKHKEYAGELNWNTDRYGNPVNENLANKYEVIVVNGDSKNLYLRNLNAPPEKGASDEAVGKIGGDYFYVGDTGLGQENVYITIEQLVDTSWNVQTVGGGYGSQPSFLISKDRNDYLKVSVTGGKYLYLSEIYCKFLSWYDRNTKEILTQNSSLNKQSDINYSGYTTQMTLRLMNKTYYRWNAPMYVEVTLRTRFSEVYVKSGNISEDSILTNTSGSNYRTFPDQSLSSNASAVGFVDSCKSALGLSNNGSVTDLNFVGLYGASQLPSTSIATGNTKYFNYDNNRLEAMGRLLYKYNDAYKKYHTLFAMFSRKFTLYNGVSPVEKTIFFTLDNYNSINGSSNNFTLDNAVLDGFSFDGWYTGSGSEDKIGTVNIQSPFSNLYARFSFEIDFKNYVEVFKYYGMNEKQSLYMNSRSYGFVGNFVDRNDSSRNLNVFEYIDFNGNRIYVGVYARDISIAEPSFAHQYDVYSVDLSDDGKFYSVNLMLSVKAKTSNNYMGEYREGVISGGSISFSNGKIALCESTNASGFTIFELTEGTPNNIAVFSNNQQTLKIGSGTYTSSNNEIYNSGINGSGIITAFSDRVEYKYVDTNGTSRTLILDKNANTVKLDGGDPVSLSKGVATFSDGTNNHSWSIENGTKTYTLRNSSDEVLFAISYTSAESIASISVRGTTVGITDGSSVTLSYNGDLGLFVSSNSGILKKEIKGVGSYEILLKDEIVLSVTEGTSIEYNGTIYHYNSDLGVYIPNFYLKYDEANKTLDSYTWDGTTALWKVEQIFNVGGDEIIFNGQTFVREGSIYKKSTDLSSVKKSVVIYGGKAYVQSEPNGAYVGSDSGSTYSIVLGKNVHEYTLVDFDDYGRQISSSTVYFLSDDKSPISYGGKTYEYNSASEQFESNRNLKKIVSAIFVSGGIYRYYSDLAASTGSTVVDSSSVTPSSGKLTYDGREFVKYRDTNLYIYSVETFDVDKYEAFGTNKYGYRITIDGVVTEFQSSELFAIGSTFAINARQDLGFVFSNSTLGARINASGSGEYFERYGDIEAVTEDEITTYTFTYILRRTGGPLKDADGNDIFLRVSNVALVSGDEYNFDGATAQLVINGENVGDEVNVTEEGGHIGLSIDIPQIILHFGTFNDGKFVCDEDNGIFVAPYASLNEFNFKHTTYGFDEIAIEGISLKIWKGTTVNEIHTSQPTSTTTTKTDSASNLKFVKTESRNIRFAGTSIPARFGFGIIEAVNALPAYEVTYGESFIVVDGGEQQWMFHGTGGGGDLELADVSLRKKIFYYDGYRIEYIDNANFKVVETSDEFVWYEFVDGVGSGKISKSNDPYIAITFDGLNIKASGQTLSTFNPTTGKFKRGSSSEISPVDTEMEFVFDLTEGGSVTLILIRESAGFVIDRMTIKISDTKWIECQFVGDDIDYAIEMDGGIQTTFTMDGSGKFVSNQIIVKKSDNEYVIQTYSESDGIYKDARTVLSIRSGLLVFDNISYAEILTNTKCFTNWNFLSLSSSASEDAVLLHRFVQSEESASFVPASKILAVSKLASKKTLEFEGTNYLSTPNEDAFVSGIYLTPENISNLASSFLGDWKVGSSANNDWSIVNLKSESDERWIYSVRDFGLGGSDTVNFVYQNQNLINIFVRGVEWFEFVVSGYDSDSTVADRQFGLFNNSVKVAGKEYAYSSSTSDSVKVFTYATTGSYTCVRNSSGGIISLSYNDGSPTSQDIFVVSGGALNEYGTSVLYNGKTYSSYDPVSNIYVNESAGANDPDKFFQFDGEVVRTFSNRNLNFGSVTAVNENQQVYFDYDKDGNYKINSKSYGVQYRVNVVSFANYLFDSVAMGNNPQTSPASPWNSSSKPYKRYVSRKDVGYSNYKQNLITFDSKTIQSLFNEGDASLIINRASKGVVVRNFFGIRPVANIKLDSRNTNGNASEGLDVNSSISKVSASGSRISGIDSLDGVIFQSISQNSLRKVGATSGTNRLVVLDPSEVRYVKRITISQIGTSANTVIVIAWNPLTGRITEIESGVTGGGGKIGGSGQPFTIKLDTATGKISIFFGSFSVDVNIIVEYERKHFESSYVITSGAKIESYKHTLYGKNYELNASASNVRRNSTDTDEYAYATELSTLLETLRFVKDFGSNNFIYLLPKYERMYNSDTQIPAYIVSEIEIRDTYRNEIIGYIKCNYNSSTAGYEFSYAVGSSGLYSPLSSGGTIMLSGSAIRFVFDNNRFGFEEVSASAPLAFGFKITKMQVTNKIELKDSLNAVVEFTVRDTNISETISNWNGSAFVSRETKTNLTALVEYRISPTSKYRMLDTITLKVGGTSYNFFVGRLNSDSTTVFANSAALGLSNVVTRGTYLLCSESSAWTKSITSLSIAGYTISLLDGGIVRFSYIKNERDVSVSASECNFFQLSMYVTADTLDKTTLENSRTNSIVPYEGLQIDGEGVTMARYMYILSRNTAYKPQVVVTTKSGYTGIIDGETYASRASTGTYTVVTLTSAANEYNIYAAPSSCKFGFAGTFYDQFGKPENGILGSRMKVYMGSSALSIEDAKNLGGLTEIVTSKNQNLSNGYYVAIRILPQSGYKLSTNAISISVTVDGNTTIMASGEGDGKFQFDGEYITFRVPDTGAVTYLLSINYEFDIITKPLYSADAVSIVDGSPVGGTPVGYLYFIYNNENPSQATVYFSMNLFTFVPGNYMAEGAYILSVNNKPAAQGRTYLQLQYWFASGSSFLKTDITDENSYTSLLNFENIASHRDNPQGICVVVWSAEVIKVLIKDSKIGNTIEAWVVYGEYELRYDQSKGKLSEFINFHNFLGLHMGEYILSTQYIAGTAEPISRVIDGISYYVYTLTKIWDTPKGASPTVLTAYYAAKQFKATFSIGADTAEFNTATYNQSFTIPSSVDATVNAYRPSFSYSGWVRVEHRDDGYYYVFGKTDTYYKTSIKPAYLSKSTSGTVSIFGSNGLEIESGVNPLIYAEGAGSFVWDVGSDMTFIPYYLNVVYTITVKPGGDNNPASGDTIINVESGGNIVTTAIGSIGNTYLTKTGHTFEGFGTGSAASGDLRLYFVKSGNAWFYGNENVYFDTSANQWKLWSGSGSVVDALGSDENKYLLVYFDENGKWCSSNSLEVSGRYTVNKYSISVNVYNFETGDLIRTESYGNIDFGQTKIVQNFSAGAGFEDGYNRYIRSIKLAGNEIVSGKYNADTTILSNQKEGTQNYLNLYYNSSDNLYQIEIKLIGSIFDEDGNLFGDGAINVYVDRETRYVTFYSGATALKTVVTRLGDTIKTGKIFNGIYNVDAFYSSSTQGYADFTVTPPSGQEFLYWSYSGEDRTNEQIKNILISSNTVLLARFGSTSGSGYFVNYFVYDSNTGRYVNHSSIESLYETGKTTLIPIKLLNLGHKVGFSSGGKTYFIYGWKSSATVPDSYYTKAGTSSIVQISAEVTPPKENVNYYAVYDELIFECENKTQSTSLKGVISAKVQLPRSYASLEYGAGDVIWYVSNSSVYDSTEYKSDAIKVGTGETFYVANLGASRNYLYAVIMNKDITGSVLLTRRFDLSGATFGIALSNSTSGFNQVVNPSKTLVTSSDTSKTLGTVRFVGLTYKEYTAFNSSSTLLLTTRLREVLGLQSGGAFTYIKSSSIEVTTLTWATALTKNNNIAKYGYQYYVAILSNGSSEVCTQAIDLSSHLFITFSYSDSSMIISLSNIRLADTSKIVILSSSKSIGTVISAGHADLLYTMDYPTTSSQSISVSKLSRYSANVTCAILNSDNMVISKNVSLCNIAKYYSEDASYNITKSTGMTYSTEIPEFARNSNFYYVWVSLDHYMKGVIGSSRLLPTTMTQGSYANHFAYYAQTADGYKTASTIANITADMKVAGSSASSIQITFNGNNAVMYLALAIFDKNSNTIISLSSNVADLYFGDKIYSFNVERIVENSIFIYRRYYSYYQWYIAILYGIDVNNYISIDASPFKYKVDFDTKNYTTFIYEFVVECKWLYTIRAAGWDFQDANRTSHLFSHVDYFNTEATPGRDSAVRFKQTVGTFSSEGALPGSDGKIIFASSHTSSGGLRFGILVVNSGSGVKPAYNTDHSLITGFTVSGYYSPTMMFKQISVTSMTNYEVVDNSSKKNYIASYYLINSVRMDLTRNSIGTDHSDTLIQ